MRVIKDGRKQAGWSRKFNCTGLGNGNGGCEATLLVEFPDLFRTRKDLYDGSSEEFVTFRCCQCGVETDIDYTGPDASEIPFKRDWLSHNLNALGAYVFHNGVRYRITQCKSQDGVLIMTAWSAKYRDGDTPQEVTVGPEFPPKAMDLVLSYSGNTYKVRRIDEENDYLVMYGVVCNETQ